MPKVKLNEFMEVFDLPAEWHRLLSDYAHLQKDERTRERLLDALNGKGAFRRAKNVLDATGLRNEWFAYRDDAAKSLAREWLEENGFEADE